MDSVNRRQNQWKYAMFVGAVNIIIGVLMIIFKRDSLSTILLISGIFLAINGAIAILGGINEKSALVVIIGIVFLALGITIAILPSFFTDIFMILLAVFLILMGVSGALSTFDASEKGKVSRVISLVIGVAMVVAGVFALLNLNTSADWLMVIIGVIMVLTGALNLFGGYLTYKSLKN